MRRLALSAAAAAAAAVAAASGAAGQFTLSVSQGAAPPLTYTEADAPVFEHYDASFPPFAPLSDVRLAVLNANGCDAVDYYDALEANDTFVALITPFGCAVEEKAKLCRSIQQKNAGARCAGIVTVSTFDDAGYHMLTQYSDSLDDAPAGVHQPAVLEILESSEAYRAILKEADSVQHKTLRVNITASNDNKWREEARSSALGEGSEYAFAIGFLAWAAVFLALGVGGSLYAARDMWASAFDLVIFAVASVLFVAGGYATFGVYRFMNSDDQGHDRLMLADGLPATCMSAVVAGSACLLAVYYKVDTHTSSNGPRARRTFVDAVKEDWITYLLYALSIAVFVVLVVGEIFNYMRLDYFEKPSFFVASPSYQAFAMLLTVLTQLTIVAKNRGKWITKWFGSNNPAWSATLAILFFVQWIARLSFSLVGFMLIAEYFYGDVRLKLGYYVWLYASLMLVSLMDACIGLATVFGEKDGELRIRSDIEDIRGLRRREMMARATAGGRRRPYGSLAQGADDVYNHRHGDGMFADDFEGVFVPEPATAVKGKRRSNKKK